MNRRDREPDTEAEDRGYNPPKPPKEESPDPYGASPFDAGRKPAESNGDLSGALGFDPSDINCLLAPKSRSIAPGRRLLPASLQRNLPLEAARPAAISASRLQAP